MKPENKKRVIVVGGGFGGLKAAKVLSKSPAIEVVMIDKRNHHLFQPLLYQVATAGLSPAEIATPIRSLLGPSPGTRVIMGEVTSVQLSKKLLSGTFGELGFDYLLLACGSETSYFGNSDWQQHAPGLKTLAQATEIRLRILSAFELAEIETDAERRKQLLTFVIVGGGPTGVELAGAIAELSRQTLVKDFKNIDPSRTRVILIEAGPQLLPSFSEELRQQAAKDLEQQGVNLWVNTKVTKITEDGVSLNEEFVKANTVLWAAGVGPSALNATLGVALDRQGRIMVQGDLSLREYPYVFVVGDQASVLWKEKPLPGLAPVALQQGLAAAENILKDIAGKSRKDFVYFDKGQMATIGRSKAVAQYQSLHLKGFIAWIAWLFVHVYYLIGFKNRIFVLMQWWWSYVSYARGARLIVPKEGESKRS